MEVSPRFADSDETQDLSDEEVSGNRPGRNRRGHRSDYHRDDHRPNGGYSGGKRRGDSELVATTGQGQRGYKASRRDGGGSRGQYTKSKFDASATLDAPCIHHSRPDRPATHTTAQCWQLKEIEKARRVKADNGDQSNDKDRTVDEGFSNDHGSLHIFTGTSSRRERKVLAQAVSVNSIVVNVPR